MKHAYDEWTDELATRKDRDRDALIIITGAERTGKTTLARRIARKLDKGFNATRMFFTAAAIAAIALPASAPAAAPAERSAPRLSAPLYGPPSGSFAATLMSTPTRRYRVAVLRDAAPRERGFDIQQTLMAAKASADKRTRATASFRPIG